MKKILTFLKGFFVAVISFAAGIISTMLLNSKKKSDSEKEIKKEIEEKTDEIKKTDASILVDESSRKSDIQSGIDEQKRKLRESIQSRLQ